MDALLSVLKFCGIALTGAFAILGLLVEYRDRVTGTINRWGKIALAGILASTTLALSTHGVEQWREQQTQKDAARRTLAELERHSVILSEISKSLQPLKDIKLSYWVEIDVDGPEFESYKARVRQGVNDFLSRYPTWQAASMLGPQEPLHLSSGYPDGRIRSLSFGLESVYYPKSVSEGLAYSALNLQAHVCLRRSPLASPHPCSYWEEGGDVRFLARADSPNSRAVIEIDVPTSGLTVRGYDLMQDSEFTRSNGNLLTVPDLLGSQIVLHLANAIPMKPIPGRPGSSQSYDPGLKERSLSVRRSTLVLIVQGREFWLSEPLLKSEVKEGKIYLYATFPLTSDGLAAIQR